MVHCWSATKNKLQGSVRLTNFSSAISCWLIWCLSSQSHETTRFRPPAMYSSFRENFSLVDHQKEECWFSLSQSPCRFVFQQISFLLTAQLTLFSAHLYLLGVTKTRRKIHWGLRLLHEPTLQWSPPWTLPRKRDESELTPHSHFAGIDTADTSLHFVHCWYINPILRISLTWVSKSS